MQYLTEDPVRSKEITENVSYRIQEQIDYFGGHLPERVHRNMSFRSASREESLLRFADVRLRSAGQSNSHAGLSYPRIHTERHLDFSMIIRAPPWIPCKVSNSS